MGAPVQAIICTRCVTHSLYNNAQAQASAKTYVHVHVHVLER
jgi:hypothetical protein